MALLIIYGIVSIFFSFLCSILEAVLLSITPTFLNVKKKEGKGYAEKLEKLKKDVDRPLIAILTLNTIAHTVGAILVGVQAKVAYAELYGSEIKTIFGISVTEDIMVGVVSSIMTILILVASEIIPKTIGATYWKQLSNFTAKALNILIFPLKWTGILWMLQLTTKLIGGKGHHGSVLSREDFTAMADIAQEEGVFKESESKVIKNLLRFKSIHAENVMTPFPVAIIAEETTSLEKFRQEHQKIQFSRIPIYKEKPHNITGFILKDELLEELVENHKNKSLADLKREILMVSSDEPIPEIFQKFIQKREHIAIVTDQFGNTIGLVTMEDIIETLLGLEIMDESDNIEDMQKLARQNWEKRATRAGLINKS